MNTMTELQSEARRETNLRFSDDTTLLCTSKEELLALLKRVKEANMSQNVVLIWGHSSVT